MNQLRAVLVTAPPTLRDQLSALSPAALIDRCAKTRPGTATTIEAGVKRTLKALARRHQQLAAEIAEHTRELTRLVEHTAPALLAEHGAGPDTAAALLIAAGDNPERLHSEAAFAALCGTNPIPASSGQTDRHRLNRGGDRQANAALHRIIIVRLVRHDDTRAYKRSHVNPNGSNKLHVIRCLKTRPGPTALPTDRASRNTRHSNNASRLTAIGASGTFLRRGNAPEVDPSTNR